MLNKTFFPITTNTLIVNNRFKLNTTWVSLTLEIGRYTKIAANRTAPVNEGMGAKSAQDFWNISIFHYILLVGSGAINHHIYLFFFYLARGPQTLRFWFQCPPYKTYCEQQITFNHFDAFSTCSVCSISNAYINFCPSHKSMLSFCTNIVKISIIIGPPWTSFFPVFFFILLSFLKLYFSKYFVR